MKLTYEMKAVFKSLFNQVPRELDDSNEKYGHVQFIFDQKICPEVFNRYFTTSLKKLPFALGENFIIIQKEGYSRFIRIIENHFKRLEMERNHKKYEFVFNQTLSQKVKEIKQIAPHASIFIEMSDEIDEELFGNIFLMGRANANVLGTEITIFSDSIADFNKAIDFLYVDLSMEVLAAKLEEKSAPSYRMF